MRPMPPNDGLGAVPGRPSTPHRLDGGRPAPGRAQWCAAPQLPALEWERLARRLAQPAAALATAPVDAVAVAPAPGPVEDPRRGRLERPEDRESGRADVEVPLGGSGWACTVSRGPTTTRTVLAARQGPRPHRVFPHGVPVDDDLGRSGGGARPRLERPLLAICEGRVGIVLAVEASRLACNGGAFRARCVGRNGPRWTRRPTCGPSPPLA